MSVLDKFSLEGQVTIITGGGAGIRKAIAELFAAAGAKVAVSNLKKETADEAAQSINEAGSTTIGLACDVTNEKDRKNLVDETAKEFGKISILVNNAGGGVQELD